VIETSSWPVDLSSWQPDEQPFYLEFFGETSPLLDESYAEVVLPGGTDPTTVRDAPVYEYWWTLGHPGTVEEHHHWYSPGSKAHVPWEAVADPAVRVYLYFPISAGWRVKEIMATLKYLAPAPEQRSWFEQARKDLSVEMAPGGVEAASEQRPAGRHALLDSRRTSRRTRLRRARHLPAIARPRSLSRGRNDRLTRRLLAIPSERRLARAVTERRY